MTGDAWPRRRAAYEDSTVTTNGLSALGGLPRRREAGSSPPTQSTVLLQGGHGTWHMAREPGHRRDSPTRSTGFPGTPGQQPWDREGPPPASRPLPPGSKVTLPSHSPRPLSLPCSWPPFPSPFGHRSRVCRTGPRGQSPRFPGLCRTCPRCVSTPPPLPCPRTSAGSYPDMPCQVSEGVPTRPGRQRDSPVLSFVRLCLTFLCTV